MTGLRSIQTAPDARVLCISNRLIEPVISRCLRYEFEDVVASVDRVDMVGPEQCRIRSNRVRRAVGWLDARLSPSRAKAAGGGYDLLFFGMQMISDLNALVPWSSVKTPAAKWACYIEELYKSRIPRSRSGIEILKRFDAIFVSYQGTVEPLAEATGRPVYCVPASVDALALCPYPNPPERVIDFYAMGRRPVRTHAALMEFADARGWFYHYDTVGESRVTNHVEHRRRFADLVKRTKYFLVNPALCNLPEKTGGQRELAFRFFEGAAGGAVMIGEAPDDETTRHYMGWRDAVIPMAYDSTAIDEILLELEADPERVERIRKTNVVNSLRLNDHVHRWGDILRILGIPETPEMEARRRLLDDLADSIERTIPGSPEQAGCAPPARRPGLKQSPVLAATREPGPETGKSR